jgi:hypothetical protein
MTTLYEDEDAPVLYGSSLYVTEGKAFGTAAHQDLVLAKNLFKFGTDPNLPSARKVGSAVGRRRLGEVRDRAERELLSAVQKNLSGKLTEAELRKAAVRAMKTAWRDVFLAGLRAGGTPGTGAGPGKSLVSLGEGDDKWLRSAMQHEMRYLNGFIDAVVHETYKMQVDRRVKMYANTLDSFYESARLIALPATVLIHWVGPNDKKTCDGCRFLFEQSPFTKYSLPTVPRAGSTACLSNCRDKLFVRVATPGEVRNVLESHDYTRDGYIRKLREIKSKS